MERTSLAPVDLLRIPRVGEPCCSPDGQLSAFTVRLPDVARDADASRIWLAGAGAPRPLTDGPADRAPRFSPCGRRLAWIGADAPAGGTAPSGAAPAAAAPGGAAPGGAAPGGAAPGGAAPGGAAPGSAPAAAAPGSAATAAAPGGGGTALWVAEIADGEAGPARRVVALPDGAGEPAWSPDGTRIALTAPVDAAAATADADAEERRAAAPRMIRRLDEKADGTGLRGTVRRQLHVVDVAAGTVRRLTACEGDASGPAWSPDGRALVFAAGTDGDGGAHETSAIHLLDADGGAPRRLTAAGGVAVAPCLCADGETVVYLGRDDPELGLLRLLAVDRSGGAPRDLDPALDRMASPGGPVAGGCTPQQLPDGRILFAVTDRGGCHLRIADLDGSGSVPLLAEPDRVVLQAALGGGTVACVLADARSCGELHLLDAVGGGAPRQLTTLVADALPGVEIAPRRERVFTAPDGEQVHGWLIGGDAGDGPRPLLVDVHGGPHSAWSPTFDAARLHQQQLVAEGWAVLLLNPRASDGYGERFMRATLGAWGVADEGDFLAAIDALVAEGIADPDRLAVAGYSYGGYMTCWLTSRTRRFRAAVAGGCVCDLRSFAGTSDVGTSFVAQALEVAPGASPEPLERLSPIAAVGAVQTPTLVLHGEADDRCPIGQGEQWFTALRARGVESEMVRYPGGDHLFVLDGRPSHRVDYGRRIVAWLQAHVTAAEAAA